METKNKEKEIVLVSTPKGVEKRIRDKQDYIIVWDNKLNKMIRRYKK